MEGGAMDGRIEFYVFSGTGNTLLAARRVADVLRGEGVPVRMHCLEKVVPITAPAGEAGVTLGLAFPVAAFSTYPLVWRFIEDLPPGNGTPVFMLATMGGFSGLLVGPLKKLLLNKGYRPLAACELRMPSNFLIRVRPQEECRGRLERGLRGAELFALKLAAGTARWRRLSPVPYAFTRWFWTHVAESFSKAGRQFHADPARCTRCGLCVRLCPVNAITLPAESPDEASVPVWGGGCEQCQRCIAFCPARAVSGPRHASGRYRAVAAAELLDGVFGGHGKP
jgi:ferredoxin